MTKLVLLIAVAATGLAIRAQQPPEVPRRAARIGQALVGVRSSHTPPAQAWPGPHRTQLRRARDDAVWGFWARIARSTNPGRVALGFLDHKNREVRVRAIFVVRREWPVGAFDALLRIVEKTQSDRCRYFAAEALLSCRNLPDDTRRSLRRASLAALARGWQEQR